MYQIIKNCFSPILLFIISLYFSLTWLTPGKILGGGDVGIPMLHPARSLSVISGSWWETQDTGTTNPVTYTAVPFYLILTLLDSVGIDPVVTQRLFFLVILFGGSICIYYLGRLFRLGNSSSFISALFYNLNFFSLSVWHRGVHNGMLFLLLAPLTLLIIMIGIREQKYIYTIPLMVVSFLLSYVYGSPAFLLSLWIMWLFFLTSELLSNIKNKENRNFLIKYCALLFFFWTITNLWWIIHFVISGKFVFGQFSADEVRQRSSDVLVALRQQTDLQYVFRGINRYLFFEVKEWGDFYKNPIINFLSWVPILIVFSTALYKRNYRSKIWKILFSLLILILIISKGVNSPFGWLQKYLYDHVFFLLLLRNPYEKTGILMIIPYALLFSLGLSQIVDHIKRSNKKAGIIVSIFLLSTTLFLLVWPLWLGETFSGLSKRSEISIPEFYKEADIWLKDQNHDKRILHLPLPPGEAVNYDWGYSGIEPSQLLFSGSSISYITGLPTIDLRIKDLTILIHNRDTENILKSFSSLNIGWVVVHNETSWKDRYMESPDKVNEWLSSRPFYLEKARDFGPLSIWKVKDEYILGHVYSPSSLSYLDLGNQNVLDDYWDEIEKKDVFVMSSNKDNENISDIDLFKKSIVIYPKRGLDYKGFPKVDSENALKELPYVRYQPDSPIYPIIKLKEAITEMNVNKGTLSFCIDLAGKRLVESALLSKRGRIEFAKNNLKRYVTQLSKCGNIDGESMKDFVFTPKGYEEVSEKLARHLSVINNDILEKDLLDDKSNAEKVLNDFMVENGVIPKFTPLKTAKDRNLLIYSFDVEREGNYAIEIRSPTPEVIGIDPYISQIDNNVYSKKPLNDANALTFGSFDFSEGVHEIHFSVKPFDIRSIEQKDLIMSDGAEVYDLSDGKVTFQLYSKSEPAKMTYRLGDIKYKESYELSFESFVIKGSTPKFIVIQDSDPSDEKGKIIPNISFQIEENNYDHYWQKQSFIYWPSLNANHADITIAVSPWNNCRWNFDEDECLKNNFFKQYDKDTQVQIKNLKIRKMISYDPQLTMQVSNNKALGSVSLKSNKISPTLYEITISDQKPPYILTFAETMHQLWGIYDSDGRKIKALHFAGNGFANSWLINKNIPEKVYIKFGLESAFKYGIMISVLGFVGITVVLFFKNRFKK